jgi:hypothetical protein
MCTSFISNRKKTIVGWNLDILDMEYRVTPSDMGVFIEINDPIEGWLPLFGANTRGDFVGMPTCHPFDERSNPTGPANNVIMLDIDLLLQKKTLQEIKTIAENESIVSVPGVTFMSSLTDQDGNVLHIIPGQGYKYYKKPKYQILTNFSPFMMDSEKHPWMGWDRYHIAKQMLEDATDDFDVKDGMEVLKAVSQEVCPTTVSMVYDVTERKVFWCEQRKWDEIQEKSLRL